MIFGIACFLIGYFHLSQAQILNDKIADSLIHIILTKDLDESVKYEIAMDISDYATSPTIRLKYAQEALELAYHQENEKRVGAAWLNIGQSYKKLGDNEKALQSIQESISHYQNADSHIGVSSAYLALGNLYIQQDNYPLALHYLNQSIEIFREEQDTSRLSTALLSAGNIYHYSHKYDSALYYLEEAETLFRMLKYEIGIAYAHGNIGLVKTSQEKYDEGHQYLTEAIEILQSREDNYSIADYQLSMAKIYQEKENANKAIEYAQHSWQIAQQDSLLAQMRDASQMLSELYAYQNNFEKAYQYQSTYIALRDSLNNEEVIRNMADMRTEFEVAQKQSEIDILEKTGTVKSFIQYGLIILLSLLIIIAMLLYGNNNLQKKANLILAQQKDELHDKNETLDALISTREKFFSIISHDLRAPVNALYGLSGLIKTYIDQKKYDTLSEMVIHVEKTALHLSMLLDNLLTWALNQQGGIPVKPEPISVQDTTEEVIGIFQTMAFSKNINLYNRVEQPLYILADKNAFFTILRNLTNNALKFTPHGGEVIIDAYYERDQIAIKVADTGIGMPQEKIDTLFQKNENQRTWGTSGEKGVGLGLQLVHDFIRLSNGSIEVNSIEGKGTTFVLLLPAYKEEMKVYS